MFGEGGGGGGRIVVERSWVGSPLATSCCVLEQDIHNSREYWLKPMKRWLRPDMTEKLLTGTFNLSTNDK